MGVYIDAIGKFHVSAFKKHIRHFRRYLNRKARIQRQQGQPDMIEITRKILVGLHHDILRRAQASGEDVVWGILYEGNLEALIYRINKSEDLLEKAAWALYSADCHPFYDGQKRTAHNLADLILRSEGYRIHATEEEVIDMLLRIAKYECHGDLSKIIKWLEENVQRLDKSRQLHFG